MPTPADGEFQGCPLRHGTRSELLRILSSYNIDDDTKAQILKKHPNEPERACIDIFKSTHANAAPDVLEHVGRHPNAFFDASIKYHNQSR